MTKSVEEIRHSIKDKVDCNVPEYHFIDLSLQSVIAFEKHDRETGKDLISEALHILSKCNNDKSFDIEIISEEMKDIRKHQELLRTPCYGNRISEEEKLNLGIACDMCRITQIIGNDNSLAQATIAMSIAALNGELIEIEKAMRKLGVLGNYNIENWKKMLGL